MGARGFFEKHFSSKEGKEGEKDKKGKKGEGGGERWEPMREGSGSNKGEEVKLIKREGEVAKYVPEEFHNRKLLPTTNERSNCGIYAILISARPDLSIKEGVKITKKVRSDLIKDSTLPPQDVMPNKPLDLSKFGEAVLDKMSKYIGQERGLIIHYSHGIAGDDHQIIRAGKESINIYLDRGEHYWGMGPEIEPQAWKPNLATSRGAVAEASLRTADDKLLAEALERSMREQ
jgi:hypothetical protein